VRGLKVNTLKTTAEKLRQKIDGIEMPVPWSADGWYLSAAARPGRDPYGYAGLFYQQEPSAMLPGAVLPIREGDRVLDLCAAPGGKSLTIACRLNHTGLLWANDISVSRAQVLLRNLERFGVEQAVVSAETPAHLAERLSAFFDAVLVDGPCSGEGMFRKEPSLYQDWQKKGPDYYAPLQQEILEEAVRMVKPGGYLVYSTCTFSPSEDEENVRLLLKNHPEFHLCPLKKYKGFTDTGWGIKLFPHRIRGEGHFVSLLQKEGMRQENRPLPTAVFEQDGICYKGGGYQKTFRDKIVFNVYDQDTAGMRILRNGLLIGVNKKGRFEPSQALAMTQTDCQTLDLSHDDPRVMKYLRGETLDIHQEGLADGWCLVRVDGYGLGFARVKNSLCKNKLDRSWIVH
jgi:16S rRNA C967 or C1407 C5-methylase (RsmB/RsmF family)/NOL1/NOP2/fmu family ribosome biogenesis protein